MSDPRKMTVAEWMDEGIKRFGYFKGNFRFVCQACGHVAKLSEWKGVVPAKCLKCKYDGSDNPVDVDGIKVFEFDEPSADELRERDKKVTSAKAVLRREGWSDQDISNIEREFAVMDRKQREDTIEAYRAMIDIIDSI